MVYLRILVYYNMDIPFFFFSFSYFCESANESSHNKCLARKNSTRFSNEACNKKYSICISAGRKHLSHRKNWVWSITQHECYYNTLIIIYLLNAILFFFFIIKSWNIIYYHTIHRRGFLLQNDFLSSYIYAKEEMNRALLTKCDNH